MPLKSLGFIPVPNGLNSDFDDAAFDPKTRGVFIAHTAPDCLEVIAFWYSPANDDCR
ncbi:hypothetical protein IVB14_04285 [Bradyrhizobium sp. 180]|uniref:hypothetical protein n=1 Tax=unclassified Bradyrhizobium TaxID=2631580 RepID=UPI001FF854E6|nr:MULTISPECIES: hypothetical protein [unclassified Bradyrhizobium]MCK1419445.1 hypothetical protein [Bradyrhizobium sp. CW12]MCK1489664.1 hypothetical protein [Bradyrhizobium sp. 180]MCK1530670.1 hypothetical protein [Bradyrhizobium sp. 182]MCK1594756.1 hypothetical protein [Bradyrhizobium sp. 164]MCK1615875.1 hypothetical protein [Bradyrhizobium sp. 159]